MSETGMRNEETGLETAVIGMVCRFPGAGDIDGFWDNLINARESTAFFSDEEMEKAAVEPSLLKDPAFVKAYGWLEDIEFFDYSFFGYTPLEAEVMDPQTCILHECAVEALENAGYNAYSYLKLIGIYVGASGSFEWQARSAWSGKNNILGWFPAEQLNDKDYLATRIAHKLDLKGPAITVDTACSTAMTALHLAYQGLLSGDCDIALAGGVSIRALGKKGYLYREGMLNSPDGHCRTFDAMAKGSNFGNGVGLVVLKRLSDAQADGDTIHAVIKSSSLNNDGTRKASYTAPSIEGQAQVIRTAHQMAEVEPESITYVETHGTGTELGDPVEIEGLKAAFNTEKKHFCRIGSVKTNIGHLEAAAGAAGFIKTVLILKHRLIPPSLFFEKSNPKIDFENSPFVVNTELTEWKPGPYPRRAGVSSFGIGGTNVHMVLEEWPQGHSSNAGTSQHEAGREFSLVLLSAKTEIALDKMTENLAEYLKKNLLNRGNGGNPANPGQILADTAYTLQVGRPLYKHRRMLVTRDANEAVLELSTQGTGKLKTFLAREDNPPVVFMFSGLGGQYVNMGRDLYEREPLFRRETDRCFEILKPLLTFDIKEIIYPSHKSDKSDILIRQTEVAQLAVFILEYALAQLLIRWGIKPDSMVGYSFGEYTAACIAGVFSLADALKVLAARGQLLRRVPPGIMLSVPLTREELNPLLSKAPGISLAIDNGLSCIIADDPGAVEVFERQMKEKRLLCTRLPQSHALHSRMMTPILEEFREILGTVTLNKPAIPYISNVTGQWITAEEVTSPTYWARHLGETVQFARGMRELLKQPGAIFMEIGPGRDISTLVMRYIEDVPGGNYQVMNLVRHPHAQENLSDLYFLLTRLGRLWLYGKPIDWTAFYDGGKRQRIPLPAYPFERESCWLPINPFKLEAQPVSSSPKSRQDPELADWYYIPSWTPKMLLLRDDDTPVQYRCWVFSDGHGLGALLAEKLEQEGHEVIIVEVGPGLVKKGPNHYMINPTQREDYHRLFRESGTRSNLPNRILHMWGVTGTGPMEEFEKIQESGFYSLLYIAEATRRGNVKGEIQIDVVTDQLQEVTGEEELCPSKATIIGPVRVVPQEFPGIRCRSIDVVLPPPGSFKETQLVEQLAEEVLTKVVEPVMAFRGGKRWIQTFQPLRLEKTRKKHLKLTEKGVYFITGGLGNIGLMLADYLAGKVKAKLILTGRSPMPPRQEWEQWLREHDETDAVSQKIKRLKIIENTGAEIRVFSLDAADKQKMQRLITRIENELGPVNGVIHAAGIMTGESFAPIQQLEIAHCREQFRPKVEGLLILEELFRERKPDFFWLLSSISTVLGGLGITAYAAANSFMDALAQQLNRTQPGKWISVNWDGMDMEKTQVSFERILSLGKVTRVVASNGGNLQERIHHWVDLGFLEEEDKNVEKEMKSHTPRPDLTSTYVAPETPIEKSVAGIFQNMFGYDRIGINDDFFELGLDSIKAIRIRVLMNKEGYDIELPDFFNYPTISKLAPVITTAKPAALHPGPTLTGETFEQLKSRYPYPVQDIYPITPMQEGMLFHTLYETQNIQAYMEQFTFRLQGDLRVPLVEKSVNELARRHDILRTAFVHEEMERPVQVVLKERTVDFFYKDLRPDAARGGREKETFIKEYIEKEKQHSFDLSRDKLMRLTVIQEEEDEYIFVLTYHHILLDGWSLGVFISEFFEIYNSYLQNKTYRLPPTRPFRTYIDWIESKNKTEGKNFWKTYLEGYEEMAGIPKKKSHKTKYLTLQDEYAAGLIETVLEEEKTQRLHQMAVHSHVTLNTLFQSVWSIVLAAYSGKMEAEKAEVVFGSVVSGRPAALEGVDNMVGCFINTIPVRVCFNYQTTFKQLLEEVQAKAIQCEPYHYYSLAEIQNQSPLKQNLLDHFLEFQNYPTPGEIGNPGLRIRESNTVETYSISNFRVFEQGNYEFVFSINPGDRLSLQFNYNTNTYDSGLIARLGRHVLKIIDQVTRDEEIIIGKITLLTEAEKRQILYEFNHKVSIPGDRGICQLLEERAAAHPARTAAVCGAKWLTYGRLMELSRGLAVYLRRRGIQTDRTVGILMERSLTMLVSILGIWKAGGAYIPLEPQEPLKRITGILQDSGAAVLITREESVKPQLQEAYQGNMIQFKGVHIDGVPLHARGDLKDDPDMNGLAYVIYTSGSTGAPKGAMIEHRGMMNHIQAKINDIKITGNSVIAQNASHTFDISVWQFYAALVTGGRTVIYPNPVILEPRRFLDQVIKNRVTILEVVPSYLAMILDSLDDMTGKERSRAVLEYLLVTGEEIQPLLIKRWREKYPGVKVVNAYGPTEASDDITHYIIDAAPGNEPAPIPIGKPLQNLKIYIVNPCMQLCPIGVKGEICVTGVGVGRGYLNDPGKTRQAFIEDPFAGETGFELYKTGDLGLWQPDGTIEFYGRKDIQVKVRGFRVEPGEIENRLHTHGKIKDAVVMVREENNDKYLCAYIVAKPGETDPIDEIGIREYLTHHLPDYMVPTYFVQLDRIPLTPNGKVDRKSLPGPVKEAAGQYEPPRDDIEKKLAGLWTEILEVESEEISIDADFFHQGGHSIKAMVLASRIHKEFNINLPLGEIFKTPHIRGLAAYIKKSARSIYHQVEPVEKKEYYPLSSAQRRLYILQQLDAGKGIAYNIPSVWQLEGEISKEKMETALQQLVHQHEDLRTFFTMVNDEPVQRIEEKNYKIQITNKEEPSGQVLNTVGGGNIEGTGGLAPMSIESAANNVKNFIRPFDLSQAPLLRMGLAEINEQKHIHVLMVDMHHIISDGLSMGILIKDFIELYAGMTLSGLRLQYKDFSQWQNRQAQGELIKRQETYWINQFSGEIPVLELPTDYPRPALQDFTGAAIQFEIGKEETAAIKSLVRRHDVTLFMLLLSVYTVFLRKLSGQEDVVVGTPITGRRHTDLQGIIGMFVNTLALRNFPVGERTFHRLLAEIKENTIKAFENQDYQYEDLVEQVKVVRDTGRNPLFDTMFILQNLEAPTIRVPQNMDIQIPGLKVGAYQYENRISKFDLTLMAVEIGDRLAFTFEYCTKLFKPETIRRFTDFFKKTVSIVLENDETLISGIEIITGEEKKRILLDFNETAAGYPRDKMIHQLFAEQVERTPDHMALLGPGHDARQGNYRSHRSYMSYISITYRELNNKCHQLAGMLKQQGVAADTIVGIMVGRSIEMIIGILGILKSGGAYLPIDLGYPQKRVDYMLKDSGAKILLTGQEINAYSSAQTFEISPKGTPAHPHLPPAPLTSLAYVIYTSGSTGNPRGVMVRHGSVVNLLWAMHGRYPLRERDVYLLKTSYLFDVSVTELFGWFLEGGRLAVLEPGGEKDPKAILNMIARQGVTHINFVPSMFHAFEEILDPGEIAQIAGLKYIFLAGEALSAGPINRFRRLNKAIALENIYGPTEAAVYASWYSLAGVIGEGPVPIGKPLPNVRLYIFNKWGDLQPIGVPGELCISGAGLARGYLNNPSLTARLFRFNRSYRSYKSYILYKTGDWAQWLWDGNIQFLGRIDHQVKIRGFRIELGEIESQLMKHKDIKETVVLAESHENGDGYLCAYIAAARDLPVPQLREYLLDRLPGYMIPTEFVRLEKIPLTKSGKLDRQKLKSAGKRLRTGVEHVAPQSANEVITAQAWKDVLKLEEVGIYDNFFDIGGTSLDMIRLNSKLTGIFKREIPIIAMYRYTTIDSFTRFLEGANRETGNNPAGTRSKAREERIKKGMEDKNKRREIRTRRNK